MKLALIFLTTFVAISHQQYFHPRMMFGFPWMSPFSQPPLAVNDYVSEDVYPSLLGLSNRNGVEQDEEFADIQSRVRGYSSNFNGLIRYRPSPSFNDQPNARFFFNLANTGNTGNNNNNNNYNPFFKTATFTFTSTVTLATIQSCVPTNNFAQGGTPPACRRKRSENGYLNEEYQFPIAPSETLSLIPTALSSPQDRSPDLISSSRDDVILDEVSNIDYNLREKRFFYANNKNFFVVSSTVTSYAFVSTTVTVTVNLIPPASLAAAVPPDVCDPTGALVPQCIPCLPVGYLVCTNIGR